MLVRLEKKGGSIIGKDAVKVENSGRKSSLSSRGEKQTLWGRGAFQIEDGEACLKD